MRTHDLLHIADAYARHASRAVLAGDVGRGDVRHVDAVPEGMTRGSGWPTCASEIPNILFQMLLRACNAVGYTNYPDNVVRAFVQGSGRRRASTSSASSTRSTGCRTCGWRWTPCSRPAASARRPSATRATSSIPQRPKYDLKYYVELAKELEKLGAHILAIKDMAGLCKPYAAELLVKTLKQEIGIPIHFHTHDTAGVQAASILKAAEERLDIADAAMAAMSGGTSQPNLNALVEALRFTPRDTGLDGQQARSDLRLLAGGPRVLPAVRERRCCRRRPTSTATRCPAGSTRTSTSRPRPWAWPPAGTEVCRTYAEVEPAVRRHRQGDADLARRSATWPCSWSPTT